MDANPRAALIQAPPQLVGRNSLFARIQQFSSSVYGPIHTAGLAFLQGADGNYWGHNAIIRVHAFMQHCGLPRLPGKPPFGGEIMSHDFIEAALLRRAGWEVWMAPDIGGSFEEPPPTLLDYLIRDRRWCQGNLQHLRIVFAQGLTLPSRLHLAMGIMSYVSSPLWLLLLVVSVVDMMSAKPSAPPAISGCIPRCRCSVSHAAELVMLVLATLVLLYGPKLLAVIAVLESPEATRAHGGAGAVLWSALWELLFATLMAPIVMLQHSWFVFSILMGMATGWNAQTRTDRALPLGLVARKFAVHTMIGLAATFLLLALCARQFRLVPAAAGGTVAGHSAGGCSAAVRCWAKARARTACSWCPVRRAGLEGAGPCPCPGQQPSRRCLDPAHELVLDDARVRDLHLALLAERADAGGRSAAAVELARAGPPRATPPPSAARLGSCCCRIPKA